MKIAVPKKHAQVLIDALVNVKATFVVEDFPVEKSDNTTIPALLFTFDDVYCSGVVVELILEISKHKQ